ncbi:electron transfer flavoprotein beta subunit lysine methyltransferase-like [Pieris brassicae]|uniref:electron transfer flavoprotein beta subunit lysine methyltransferase-like n=1 Tax=Pieris brassicae TaxID=7116 RepID=UPI001E660C82|nr:electron transfer flavoprotein beta subunit lysine methyltransferase-like [Pieris brassicae]
MAILLKEFTSLFLKHTKPTRSHLTPELVLRLVTADCSLWSAPADQSPFKDPFWGFYWPGGQAIARYILDNADSVNNCKILDVGCGCGAGALAAAKVNAKLVVANDIDFCALYATKLNADLNDLQVETSCVNLIGDDCNEFDAIFIGDMFYDEDFANLLFDWLIKLSKKKMVLIGDPGRHGLTDRRRKQMHLLAQYEMPKISCKENNGFTHTTVWTLNT